MQGDADQLHRRAMVDECTESVFSNEIRQHIAIVLRSVRSPRARYMHMAKALSFSDVLEKLLVVTQAILFVVQCELSPHEDLIRSFREMYTIPRLKTHGRR